MNAFSFGPIVITCGQELFVRVGNLEASIDAATIRDALPVAAGGLLILLVAFWSTALRRAR